MIDEETMTNLCAGVDLNASFPSGALREKPSVKIMPVLIGFMGTPVTQYRLKTRVAQQDFETAVYCRVSAEDCIDFFFQILEHLITEFLLPEFPDTLGLPAGCSVPGRS